MISTLHLAALCLLCQGSVAPEAAPGLAPTSPRQDSRPVAAEPAGDDLTQAELEAMTARILADIEELRGKKYTREVKVAIADKQGFLTYAMERMETMVTPDKLRAEELVLKLFGLIDPEMDYLATQLELLEGQVGGFYDPATESFYLMSSFQGGLAKIILAHELTHALDDQLYDIDGTLEALDGNADAQLAYQAVVEGSGTGLMNRWMFANIGKEVSIKDLAGASEMDATGLDTAPECMWKPMLMVYLRGASFLVRSDNVMKGQMGKIDNDDLHQAFSAPPRSTEQVLHPEKYWDAEQLDEPRVFDVDAAGLVDQGWKLLSSDTLGEASLALITSPLDERGGLDVSDQFGMLRLRYTNEAAMGWGGDRYVLLEKDGALLFHLTSAWDSAKDAAEFRANLDAQRRHLVTSLTALADGGDFSLALTGAEDSLTVAVTIAIGLAEGTRAEDLAARLNVREVMPQAEPAESAR